MPDRQPDPHWREREEQKWRASIRPIWSNEAWWRDSRPIWRDHYVRVADDDSTMLVYVASPEKGMMRVHTRVRPGRYLSKYFGPESDVPLLTEKQIKALATWQATGVLSPLALPDQWDLDFAADAAGIAHVYANGPRSCMSPPNFGEADCPARTYGAGDLAVAYLRAKSSDISCGKHPFPARCLVWVEKKIMGRVYPTRDYWQHDGFSEPAVSDAINRLLYTKLRDSGYRSIYEHDVTFTGARLLKVPRNRSKGAFVAPFLDGGYGLVDGGDFWLLRPMNAKPPPTYPGGGQQGYFYTRTPARCSCCGDEANEEDGAQSVWGSCDTAGRGANSELVCGDCYRARTFRCAGSGERFNSNSVPQIVTVDGHVLARQWALTHRFFRSSADGRWYSEAAHGRVGMWNGSFWTNTQFRELGFTCEVTHANFSNDLLRPALLPHKVCMYAPDDEVRAFQQRILTTEAV